MTFRSSRAAFSVQDLQMANRLCGQDQCLRPHSVDVFQPTDNGFLDVGAMGEAKERVIVIGGEWFFSNVKCN